MMPKICQALKNNGCPEKRHPLYESEVLYALFGRGQVILRDEAGVLCGGSDPRADGYAGSV